MEHDAGALAALAATLACLLAGSPCSLCLHVTPGRGMHGRANDGATTVALPRAQHGLTTGWAGRQAGRLRAERSAGSSLTRHLKQGGETSGWLAGWLRSAQDEAHDASAVEGVVAGQWARTGALAGGALAGWLGLEEGTSMEGLPWGSRAGTMSSRYLLSRNGA